MNHQDQSKDLPKQVRSPPPQDGSPRADLAALNGRPRKSDYTPYQDAVYYNNDNSASYSSEDRFNRDPQDRYHNDKRYSEVYERVRRRRRGGNDDNWEDHRYEPGRLPLTEYHGKERYGNDEAALPVHGHDDLRSRVSQRQRDDHRSRHNDRRSRSASSDRSHRRHRSRSRSNSRSRSPSRSSGSGGRRNNGPDPNTRPQDDPKRPSEGYTALKALKAGAWAGGVEVVRCRMEPGPWSGQKGKRVALAASVGVVIGALRNGRNQASGKMPYAEAAMTGFYAIDFLKRVARHTEHGKNSVKEQEEWHRGAEVVKGREERARRFAEARG